MRKMVKLGELYSVHNGLAKGHKFFGTGYPFLSFTTVFNNFFIPQKLNDLVESTEKERQNYDIRRGDIFVTRTSETSDELGMSSVALKDYPDATYNGFSKRLRPIDPTIIDPVYIGYYFRMPEFRNGFQAFSTMTTRASLKNEDLLGMEVWLPEMKIQKAIASILEKYDELIESNNQQISLLEEAAQRIYKEWFIDLRFPGYENCNIEKGIPEGWHKGRLKNIADFKRGKVITKANAKNGDIPVVAGGLEPAYFHNVYNAEAPVITVSGSGANAGYVHLYHENIWASDCSFVDKSNKYIFFVYEFLVNSKNKIDLLKRGSAQPHVYAKDLNDLEGIIPSSQIIKSYCDCVSPVFKNIKYLQQENKVLVEARNRLLPKLMSGEIEV